MGNMNSTQTSCKSRDRSWVETNSTLQVSGRRRRL